MTIIPSEGSLSAPIFFIGENPALEETKLGRPFVGRAGREQDRLNSLVRISRTDARWGNVIPTRPPTSWIVSKPKDLPEISYFIDLSRKPSYEHFLSWVNGELTEPPKGVNPEVLPHIRTIFKEVEHFHGNVIVPLGNVPLWVLTGLAAITKRRGSILSSRGRKLVPCIHPSAVLRWHSAIETRLALLDLERVKQESKTPKIVLPQRELLIYPTFEEAMLFLDECLQLPQIGFDIEVMKTASEGKEVSCWGFATALDRSMCIPVHSKGRSYFFLEEEVEIMQKIAEVLEAPTVTKIGQNIIFDCSFVYRKFGILCAPVEDTMIAQSIRFPDSVRKEEEGRVDNPLDRKAKKDHTFSRGLDFLCRHYTREPYYKDEGKEWGAVPAEREADFFRYNAKDACIVLEIFPKIMELIEQQDEEVKR